MEPVRTGNPLALEVAGESGAAARASASPPPEPVPADFSVCRAAWAAEPKWQADMVRRYMPDPEVLNKEPWKEER